MPHSRGWSWVVVALFTVVMLGGTIPTPLYPFYVAEVGLTALMITVVFVAYAIGTIGALLFFGGLSDDVGRKRVLALAVAVAALSDVAFLLAGSVPVLLVGRLLSGFSVGLVTGTATAYLGELHPDRRRSVTLATVANMGGLGLGTLLAGLLAEHAPAPTRLSYLVHLVAVLPLLVVLRAPESVADRRPPRIRLQRLALPAGAGAAFGSAAAGAFAAFAVLGLFTALTSTFVTRGLGSDSHQLVGLLVFGSFAAGTVGQLAQQRLGERTAMTSGLSVLPVGLALIVAALQLHSVAAFAAASVVGGAGVGLTFKSALATAARVAPEGRRAEVTSSLFLVAYSGLVLPVLGAGLLVQTVGLMAATLGLGGLILALVAAALLLGRRSAGPSGCNPPASAQAERRGPDTGRQWLGTGRTTGGRVPLD